MRVFSAEKVKREQARRLLPVFYCSFSELIALVSSVSVTT